MKHFLHTLFVCGALAAGQSAASAQEPISGYFRVQNAAGVAADNGYVQVRGPFTAEPDQTFAQAATEAGSIMYLHATPEEVNGQTLYRIDNLRCQGIEVVGEPIADYMGAMQEILLKPDGLGSKEEALWSLVRGGFEHGYVSIGRAVMQTLIAVVATRLDSEGLSASGELAEFADRFNHEVADNLNLNIYLEPSGEGYRLLYDTPDLKCVSDWYLKDENKTTFEKGFAAMRKYLFNKMNASGEFLDDSEIAEMQAWGYDPLEKYGPAVDYNDMHGIHTTYETIFADHELLFNWLKLNMIKFTDEDRCPKIELMGFYLPDFAKEMKQHHLTQMLISYFPRIRTNERCYLTDGKNGVFGHLDFTSVEGAQALGAASQWVLKPVTDADGAYFCVNATGHDKDGYYAAVYTDFPMKAADPEKTRFYNLGAATKTKEIKGQTYHYFELEPIETVEARTPVLVEMTTANASDHRIVPVSDLSLPTPPAVRPDGFAIGDEEVATQRSLHRAAPLTEIPYFSGVLLATPVTADGFKNQWNQQYDEAAAQVHRLTTAEIGGNETLWLNKAESGSTLPANEACLVKMSTDTNGFAVKEPMEKQTSAIDAVEAVAAEPAVVYDLNGVRVDSMSPGRVYILNGKKIIAL